MAFPIDRIVWPILPWSELTERYRAGLAELQFEILFALAVGLVLSLPLLMPRPRAYRWLGVVVMAMSVAWGVWRGWELLWIGDDAFISFRYSENFAQGNGLVFNPGERVEGYTNFLWTVLIGVGIWLGQDPIHVAVLLSLASFAGVVVVAHELVRRLAPWNAPVSAAFVAPVLACSYILNTYATSGLETMFGALLVLLALWCALVHRPALSGTFGVLAAMTHPDHGIFYAVLGLVLLLDRERRHELLRYAAPFVLIYLPYFLWRYSYYGDLFPNTYYAKSGDKEYFRQGWVYVAVSGYAAGLVGALPLALFGALARHRHFIARYFVLATVSFAIYVAKIGGDFMLGRLFVPVIPVVLIMAELGARELFAADRRYLAPAGLLGVALMIPAALPVQVIRRGEKKWHIADERTFYPIRKDGRLVATSQYARWGKDLNIYIASHGVKPLAAFGCCGMLSYYSKLPILDVYGLADREVARKPIPKRGRPGHEKLASPGYVVKRGARIAEHPSYPPRYNPLTEIRVGPHRFFIPTYDARLMDVLAKEPGLRFTDIRVPIAEWNPDPSGISAEDRWCDAWFFDQYYFQHNRDDALLERARAKMVAAEPELKGLESFLLSEPGQGYRRVREFHLDSRAEGWLSKGRAFASWPSHAVANQETPVNQVGGFANSMVAKLGDRPTGMLISPEFTLEGEAITLLIGGGKDIRNLRASLVVDGKAVRNATGCTTEILGRRVWRVSDLRGKKARIEIVDNSARGWGHIMVDEIIEWAR